MYAYFDIGGTKTRIAVSEDGDRLSDVVKFDTPQDFDEGIALILRAVAELSQGATVRAIGGGLAGPLDREHTMLVNAPHLPGWIRKPFSERLKAELACPVFLENDSAIVALGEAHHGAGKGDDIMAYLTVSTGMGGARIVHGAIDVNVFGFEPGHQYIDFDTSAYGGALSGLAQDYLSGTATARRFNKKAYEVDDPAVWEELARWLAYALNNTIVHWSPQSVVLGGSMIVGDPAIPLERVEYHMNEVCQIFSSRPVLKQALLKDRGGIYGAMTYVAQQIARGDRFC